MQPRRLLNFLDIQHPTLFDNDARRFLDHHFDVIYFDRADWSASNVQKYFYEAQPDVILTGWGCEKLCLTDEIMESVPSLQVWAHVGSSLKAIFNAPNAINHIRVLTAAPIIGKFVAESAVGHLIYGLRHYRSLNSAFLAENHWGHFDDAPTREKSLYHATIGLVGLGKVGHEVVRLLRPFNTKILVHDPFLPKSVVEELGINLVPLKVLLQESDAVSLHAAATDKTYHLIDAKELSYMQNGSGLVNTARGPLINTAALAKEVEQGRLWCAIDTYEQERRRPFEQDPLFAVRHSPHCFLTPHVAGIVPTARKFMVPELLRETLKVLLDNRDSFLTASKSAFVMG